MPYDEQALGELLEESQDTHSDAMRSTRVALNDMVELGHDQQARGVDPDETRAFTDQRRQLIRKSMIGTGALATAGLGAAMLGLLDTPAFAQSSTDVQIMQTAASLEVLAVATYTKALTLPFMAGVPAVVKAFAMKTKDQHGEHRDAFNGVVAQLGGQKQTNPDPVLLDVVNKAVPTLKTPADVVDLAITLETGAAETYAANVSALSDLGARKAVASVMGVEAQHVAILNAVKALLAGNLASQIALPPPDLAKLPAAAGSVGFPDAFLKTDQARPNDEGAVK